MPEEPSETRLRRRNFWLTFLVGLLIVLAMSGMRLVICIIVATALYFALKRVAGDWNRDFQATPNVYFYLVSFAVAITLSLTLSVAINKFGAKRPGSFFERSKYEATLYVYLYPMSSEARKVTSHRVPAIISASIEGETDQDEHYQSWREYWLLSAFTPKGVRITFE
ncbi:MAG: hypothetical protein ACREMY_14490, partial [bacterium]